MKQKKKLGIIIAIVAAVLVVGVIIFFALKPNGINSQEETSEEKGYHELADGENPADIDVKVKSSNDFVKPGKDTLDASKIQGYSAKVGDSDKKMILRIRKKQSKSFFPIRTSRLSPSVLIPVLL